MDATATDPVLVENVRRAAWSDAILQAESLNTPDQAESLNAPDAAEGIRAVLEKRVPSF